MNAKLFSRGRVASIVVLGFVVAGGLFYFHFFLRLPTMGSGPAGADVPREAFESPWSLDKTVLLGLGDSVTAGFGASPGKSYFDRLHSNPPDEFPELQGVTLSAVYPNLSMRNIAVSGSNSAHCLETQLPDLETYPDDVRGIVVLTTGGNDLIHWYGRNDPEEGAMYGATLEQAEPWIANYEARLTTILETLSGRFPGGCDIFVANIYDPSDETGDPSTVGLPPWRDLLTIHSRYNEVIVRCAAAFPNVHLVDMLTPFLGHGATCRQPWRKHHRKNDPHYWYSANIEDPNNRGYDALRRAFLNTMAEVLQ
jgi:lysophospholipase L1-like esterase